MSIASPDPLAQEARAAAEQAHALLHYAAEAAGRLLVATRALQQHGERALPDALRALGAAEDLLQRATGRLGAAGEALAERAEREGRVA